MELGPAEVHLWLTEPAEARALDLGVRYRALLSPDEAQRYARFVFEEHRHLFLVGRALIRSVLGEYLCVDPRAVRFVRNAHNRPELAPELAGTGLRFNFTDTGGLCALAVTRIRDIGVDAEQLDRRAGGLQVAERYFAPSELEALSRLPSERQMDRFFDLWTLKEAYIKAVGLGLSCPLDQFAFDLDSAPGEVRVWFDPRREDNPARWWFTRLSPTSGHRVSVAAACEGTHLRLCTRKIVPLVLKP